MGTEYLTIAMLSGLENIYKLLAVVVALYFPVAMLTWLAIDKLHKAGDDNLIAPRRRLSDEHGRLTGGYNTRHDP